LRTLQIDVRDAGDLLGLSRARLQQVLDTSPEA